MASVVKATVGTGWLGSGQTTWWGWKITYGDAWYFWAEDAGMSPSVGMKRQIEVVRTIAVLERVDSSYVRYALVQLHNPGTQTSSFVLRVVRVV